MSNQAFQFFPIKDSIPKGFISGVNYKFQCGLSNESYYGENIRHLDIRSGDHIGVSPLTRKNNKYPIAVPFVIIYFNVIINIILTTLAFWLMRIKSFYSKSKKPSSNER